MKKTKVYLTILMIMLILAAPLNTLAHGSQVNSTNAITMPESLSNGKGDVSTSISGNMSFQFVEISSSKYEIIKKYETICHLIRAYINGSSNYDSLATSYESTYNQTADGIMTEYGIQFDEEGYNAIRGLWVAELTSYSESAWISAEGRSISLDLNTFTGTKYYIAWVKIGDTYDAEAYKVTGTKSNENTNPSTEPKSENKVDNIVKTPDTTSQISSTDKTTVQASKLPQTGLNETILAVLMIVFVITGVVSYIKYKSIK